MIKVCFQGMYSSMDSASIRRLRTELINLAEKESQLEFWFTGCHNGYEKKAVEFILQIKALLPKSQIDVVAVVDPIKYEKLNIEEFDEVKNGFPRDSVSKIVYAPRIEGKSEMIPNRFVEHSRKVMRWVIEQCDLLIAYHYESVPDYTNTEIKRIRKKGNIKIISLYDPEVAKVIDEYIDNLEGRDKIVLQGLRAGRTYKSLATELDISINRVQQITNKAIRHMMQEIRKRIKS